MEVIFKPSVIDSNDLNNQNEISRREEEQENSNSAEKTNCSLREYSQSFNPNIIPENSFLTKHALENSPSKNQPEFDSSINQDSYREFSVLRLLNCNFICQTVCLENGKLVVFEMNKKGLQIFVIDEEECVAKIDGFFENLTRIWSYSSGNLIAIKVVSDNRFKEMTLCVLDENLQVLANQGINNGLVSIDQRFIYIFESSRSVQKKIGVFDQKLCFQEYIFINFKNEAVIKNYAIRNEKIFVCTNEYVFIFDIFSGDLEKSLPLDFKQPEVDRFSFIFNNNKILFLETNSNSQSLVTLNTTDGRLNKTKLKFQNDINKMFLKNGKIVFFCRKNFSYYLPLN